MVSKINRRKLGNTGLNVSELSFGAMNLRMLDSIDQAYELLNFVLDQGVNLIDTARAYNGENGQGKMVESEVLVGNAIRNRTDLNEPIVIITKGHGYTPDEFDKDLYTSLSKLGVEGKGNLKIGRNDIKLIYFFHGINEMRWKTIKESGVLDKAQKAKEDGVINYIGFSSHYHDAREIREALDTGIFDVIELPYNIFNRSLGEDGEIDLIKYAFDRGVGVVNMKAFNGNGMPAIYRMLRDFISIDYRVMLNFCLSNPYITTVDAGVRYIEEFKQDMDVAAGDRLTEEEIRIFKAEADKVAGDMNKICRECLHCLEKFQCPQGIDFPAILALYSRYMIAQKLHKDTLQLTNKYKEFTVNAEDCIACEQCMEWCEYKLNIPEMLKKAGEALA